MKKNILCSLLIFSFILAFSACDIVEITENAKITSPDIKKSATGIIVSLKNSIQDVEYVNFYRQDITGFPAADESTFPIENIGLVFTLDNNTTFVYNDDNLFKNRTYRYYVRLYDKNDGYTKSEWTAGITPTSGLTYDGSTSIYYGIGTNTKLIYNENEKKLVISGTITAPNGIANFETEYSPALVFSCSEGTQAVKISSSADSTEIYLDDILPETFFNVDVKILGIVGQYEEIENADEEDEELQRVVWTGISAIPVYNTSGTAISENTIVVKVKHGNGGYDYSF